MKGSFAGFRLQVGVLFLAIALPGTSLALITFERTYGGNRDDIAHSVQQTEDGGYIMAGETQSFGAGLGDVYLYKTDSLGNTQWSRVYGGSGIDIGHCVRQTEDGGYIVAGETWSFGSGLPYVYLVKTDSLGDTLWTRTFADRWAKGYSVRQTQDGGYIAVGVTEIGGSVGQDAYLVKVDSSGQLLWTRHHGGPDTDMAYCVRQTTDGGFIVVGETLPPRNLYILRTDSLGDPRWARVYGGAGDARAYFVDKTEDGGYIITGYANTFGSGDGVYLLRTDSIGDTLWSRRYGTIGGSYGRSVLVASDGGYVVAGGCLRMGGNKDVLLLKTDSNGDSVWSRSFGGILEEQGAEAQQTRDGGYILLGSTWSFGTGSRNMFYLIKTDENGLTGVEEAGTRPLLGRQVLELMQNHPNPFNRSTAIAYSLAQTAQITLSIYDITGRLVETLVNGMQQPGMHEVHWNRKTNPSGVYFYRLNAGEFVRTRKMVVVE